MVREPTVEAVMTRQVVTARPGTSFKDLVGLMAAHGISGVPVVDERDRPVGVVSEADALAKREYRGGAESRPLFGRERRRAWRKAAGLTAADLMTSPAIAVDRRATVASAARLLAENKVRRLCVVGAEGELVGVLSRRDVIATYLRPDAEIEADLRAGLRRGAIRATVTNGLVTLEGHAGHRTTAEAAARLARAVPGVVGVRDRIRLDTLPAAP